MSTRAQVRFATREPGVSFNEHPDKINAQFYVHSDGYPEGLGCQIAESLTNYGKLNNWELEHVDIRHGDLEFIYYVWQDHSKHAWISIFTVGCKELLCPTCDQEVCGDPIADKCIFVGKPDQLLSRFDERHCECECDYGKELCGTGCIKNTN
jgi:hypothetical protein